MPKKKFKPLVFRWTRSDLFDCSFNIGDQHQFASNNVSGRWYWTLDNVEFWGPYNTRREAARARKKGPPFA